LQKKVIISDLVEEVQQRNLIFTVLPVQKNKKRRKNRWSNGYISKKKSSSPVSRDDAQLGSDEDEEDREDEDEAEKGGEAEHHEGDGAEKGHSVDETEPEPVAPQDGSSEPNARAQNSREEDVQREMKAATEDEVFLCEKEKTENDSQVQSEKDKAVSHQSGLSETENNRGDENHETTSVNINKDSHTETEGDPQNTTKEETITQNQSETQIVRSRSAEEEPDSKMVTVEEAELTPAAPMEVDTTEDFTTDASAATTGETDTGTGCLI